MTSRERLIKAVSREVPDRVPRDISWGFTPKAYDMFVENTGQTDPNEYFRVDYRFLNLLPSKKQYDYLRYYEGRGLNTDKIRLDEWGTGHIRSENTDLHYEHFIAPLQTSHSLHDMVDFPLPDHMAPYRTELFATEAQALRDRGLGVVAPLATTLFEVAWQIRGLDEFLSDMVLEPEIIDCLLDRILEMRIHCAEQYARADVDVLMLGDDVSMQTGMMISPAQWRHYYKPRMAKIIDAARAIKPGLPVFYHSDGNPTKIIDELIEIGVTILNPIQPECMDPAMIKKQYGDRIALWGTLGIQHTLPFGTPEDVRQEVKLRMETAGRGGGLVLGPTHMIAPEVPWKNLVALYDAIDEFGNYDI